MTGPLTFATWPALADAATMFAVQRVVASGRLIDGPEVDALEAEWAAYCGARFAVALSSGTAAVHAGLLAAGVGPGDEVIVPALTFSGSVLPVVHLGARPVFADIDPVTFNLTADTVRAALTPRTAAVLVVHLHGTPADLDGIAAAAGSVPIVEDACQAHGAVYAGAGGRVRVGTYGLAGAVSLNQTKALPAGEGGLLTTDDPDVAAAAREFRRFGEELIPDGPDRTYEVVDARGGNYRMEELPAAIARVQLRRLDERNAVARRNAAYLSGLLRGLPGLRTPTAPGGTEATWHKYRVLCDTPWLAVAARRMLGRVGVPVGRWQTMPVPAYRAFRPYVPAGVDFPVARGVLDRSFLIFDERRPLCAQTDSTVAAVAELIRSVWSADAVAWTTCAGELV